MVLGNFCLALLGAELQTLIDEIARVRALRVHGRVSTVLGMLVDIDGLHSYVSVGDRCEILGRNESRIRCEVVGFRNGSALAMPFTSLEGVGLGNRVEVDDCPPEIYPHESWLGRVIDAFAAPLDGGGALRRGARAYGIRNAPPPFPRTKLMR